MKKNNSKKVIIGAIALVVVCAVLLLVYKNFMPKGAEGDKTVTVKVVHGDGSEKEFSYATDEAYLGAVIQAENLVEGEEGQYGLFMTSVDGEKADDSKQQWWCLTKGGEQVNIRRCGRRSGLLDLRPAFRCAALHRQCGCLSGLI